MNAYGLTVSAGMLSAVTLAIVTIDVGAQTAAPAPATFDRDVASHPAEELPELPSSGSDRPDVVADVQGGASLGAVDQERGDVGEDASVVRRFGLRAFSE